MAKVKMPHPGHGQHLCYLTNIDFQNSNSGEYKKLVKNAKFMCKTCGRAAAKKSNLCRPVNL